jgi:hypothetical protein
MLSSIRHSKGVRQRTAETSSSVVPPGAGSTGQQVRLTFGREKPTRCDSLSRRRISAESRTVRLAHQLTRQLNRLETCFVHRSQQENQKQPSLIQLTGFHLAMISVRFWIGITRDPVTVFSTQLRQVIVPMWAQTKGITNQCPNYSAGSTICNVRHQLRLLSACRTNGCIKSRIQNLESKRQQQASEVVRGLCSAGPRVR